MRMTPSDNGYLVETSSGNSINLTIEEALELAPLAHQIQHEITSPANVSCAFLCGERTNSWP